ncbi:MAG: hypothetical protein HUJ29_00545 [Gammaproteobacteria bacterium]|nr:hypothetical protein [Gammaproteobacteria bacterium]
MSTISPPPKSITPDDEISLIDLIRVLLRRKKTIVLVFLIVTALGVIVTMLVPQVYESRAVVLIGKVTNQLIEEPDVLVQRLIEEYEVGDTSETEKEFPIVESISVDKRRASTILELTVRGETAEGARSYLDSVVQTLFAEHKSIYEKTLELEYQRLESMKEQITELDSLISQVHELLSRLKRSDPVQASVLAIESGKYLAMKPSLEEKYVTLDILLSELKTKPTQYLREPTLPLKTKQPRSKLYIAVSVIVGIFLGIFAAFIHEFMTNVKRELSMNEENG